MMFKLYSHVFSILLAIALGAGWTLAENSSTTTSSVDIYIYTLTYTTSGLTTTSVCQDWTNDKDNFHTLPACPGTNPDVTTTADTGVSFTLRNYSSLTTSSTTTSASLTLTRVSSVGTTSASVSTADVSAGTASGSASSSTASSTSAASASAGRVVFGVGYLVLFSGLCAFLA